MKRNIVVGIIILTAIAAMLAYFWAVREPKEQKSNSIEPTNSDIDSTQLNNKVIPAVAGAKPEQNSNDRSVKIVEEFIKSNAMNPSTFEFLEWSEISLQGEYWAVRCKYKGVSSFNAEVTTNAWFYIQKNKVIRTKIISKI